MKQNRQENDFDANRLRKRARALLAPFSESERDGDSGDLCVEKGELCPAAVLVPIIARPEPAVLFTRRTDDHPHHAGQISFPGGKITPDDDSIVTAALRETREETGIEAHHVEILGHLAAHKTGTGFAIYPVVGLLMPPFVLRPCAREVAEIFEVPLSFLMARTSYRIEKLFWRGKMREFYVIDYGNHRIWGATAAILKMLQEKLYE